MRKHFLVSQPPLTDKIQFLVDEIDEFGNSGIANDIDKILYNLDLLSDTFNINIEVQLLMATTTMTAVHSIGRFITIIVLSPDKTSGSMTFMDFDFNNKEKLRSYLLENNSESIANQWFELSDSMHQDFTEEQDRAALLKYED